MKKLLFTGLLFLMSFIGYSQNERFFGTGIIVDGNTIIDTLKSKDDVLYLPYNFGPSGKNQIKMNLDTPMHSWVYERVWEILNANQIISLDSTDFWHTKSNFTISGLRQVTLPAEGGVIFRSNEDFTTYFTLERFSSGTFYSQMTGFNSATSNRTQIEVGGTGQGRLFSSANLPFRYGGDYTANMTDDRDIIDKGFADANYWKTGVDFTVPDYRTILIPNGVTFDGTYFSVDNSDFEINGGNSFNINSTALINAVATGSVTLSSTGTGNSSINITKLGGTGPLSIVNNSSGSTVYSSTTNIPFNAGSDYSANYTGLSYTTAGWVQDQISDSLAGFSGGVSEAYVATSIDSVDNASEIFYTPATTGDWPGTDPDDVGEALDSLSSRLTSLELNYQDVELTPAATTGDNQSTTLTISNNPKGYVMVFVNGTKYSLGDGIKTKDCYFSGDTGTTARTISAIISTDVLYWNGVIAGFDLAGTDVIDLIYIK